MGTPPTDLIRTEDIAIVGMSAHIPGAKDVASFWSNLKNGVESIRTLTAEELLDSGVSQRESGQPNYVAAGGFLEDLRDFDPEFFGLGGREGAIMDPQHRHFLECSWEALEDAGHVPEKFDGAIGVYAGCGPGSYFHRNVLRNQELLASVGYFLLRHTGNDKDFLPTRVSYALNLKGPSIGVQTACSTSLVAVHMAAQALLSGECDMALAGGVTIEVPHHQGYVFRENEILSPDGHCRPFDMLASGTVFGSGAGVVVLRRVQDAIDDGDDIYAVIRGTAVNNDGAGKVSYLAPSVDGQAAAIIEALEVADVSADTIELIEAHGTGTALGDPIEIAALTVAHRHSSDGVGYCGLGSVKSNIGHLDTAAGVISLIKAALALKNQEKPPSLNWTEASPTLGLKGSPFYVNSELRPWPRRDHPRRAAVNSLGVGGTNAHAILQEAPATAPSTEETKTPQVLRLSAKTTTALDAAASRLAEWLEEHPDADLAQVAWTLERGRADFTQRRVITATTTAEAASLLRGSQKRRVLDGAAADTPKAAFLFPGGGAGYLGMGTGLLEQHAVYRETVEAGLRIASEDHGLNLRPYLAADPSDELEELATAPSLQLPALFIVEVALARLWQSAGAEPVALLGHSLGEISAACVAGTMQFEEALGLTVLRGRLFETVRRGSMLSIAASVDALQDRLHGSLGVAADNAPDSCTVAGTQEEIQALAAALESDDVDATIVPVDVAAHSALLEDILPAYHEYVANMRLIAPQIPIYSNRSGELMTDAQATSPEYWVEQLRHTVRFRECADRMLKENPELVLVEVGPGATLTSLAKQQSAQGAGHTALTTLRHRDDAVEDHAHHLTALGGAWTRGLDHLAPPAHAEHKLHLPTYRFDHRPCWIEPAAGGKVDAGDPAEVERLSALDDFFFEPSWNPTPLPSTRDRGKHRWMVFADEMGVGDAVVDLLRAEGHEVIRVRNSNHNGQISDDEFLIDSDRGTEGVDEVLDSLAESERLPDRVVHLWPLTGKEAARTALNRFAHNLERSFYSLFFLIRGLAERDGLQNVHVLTVSNGARQVFDEAVHAPEKATLDGPALVAPHEAGSLTVSTLDLDEASVTSESASKDALAARIFGECRTSPRTCTLAIRNDVRYELNWQRNHQSVTKTEARASGTAIESGGLYMITGGLGGVGLALAEALASQAPVKLLLVGRRGAPPRSEWRTRLLASDTPPAEAAMLRALQQLEANGAEVEIAAVDITDHELLLESLTRAEQAHGPLRGVIHAAGTIQDSLMPAKTVDEIEMVFAPKIYGTQVLDMVLGDRKLDFMVLCSSLSSVIAPAGQSDYVAASAYLNAYARARSARTGQRTISMLWGVWQEVGIAARAARDESSPPAPTSPLFRDRSPMPQGATSLQLVLSSPRDWRLNEHRLNGLGPVLPGTGTLELLIAAAGELTGSIKTTLRDLQLFRPVQVKEGHLLRARVTAKPLGDAFALRLQTLQHAGSNQRGWLTHGEARVTRPEGVRAEAEALDLIRDRCNTRRLHDPKGLKLPQEDHLQFGPRWRVLHEVLMGEGEALAELRLPEEFESDLAQHPMHPGLLDLATGFGMLLLPGYGEDEEELWLPSGNAEVQVHGPLPAHIFSWARLVEGERTGDKAIFDYTLFSPEGDPLLEVRGMAMHRASPQAVARLSVNVAPSDLEPVARGSNLIAYDAELSPAERALRENTADGILPEEGMQAFLRAITEDTGPELLVTSLELDQLRLQMAAASPREDADQSARFERPPLDSQYCAPRDGTEQALADIWAELLGIDRVGIEDDFFALGGHSLLAVRLFARIRKAWGISLTINTLFDAPTIEALAKMLPATEEESGDNSSTTAAPSPSATVWSSLVALRPEGDQAPLFCVAGKGGNPMNLRHLAARIHQQVPFYGIQHRGLDGLQPPHTSVEEMAADCLEDIRKVQPSGPYRLGGFSAGGLVAFEMAHQLLRAGEHVSLLAFLDTPSPERLNISKLRRIKMHLQELIQRGPRYLMPGVKARARRILDRMRRDPDPKATATDVKTQDPGRVVAEAWLHMEGAYAAQRYPGKAVLFRPYQQGNQEWSQFLSLDEFNGWRPLVKEIEVVELPGGHSTMCQEPHVRVFARKLNLILEMIAARSEAAD